MTAEPGYSPVGLSTTRNSPRGGLSARPNPTGALQLRAELSATGMAVALELPGAERVGGEEMNGGWKASQ